MTTSGKFQVTFINPRDSREFKAEVGPLTTAGEAITGLVKAGFIQAPGPNAACVLVNAKSGASILNNAALSASGIGDGDIVHVTLTSSGAGVDR
ncbi:MAG: hypothetical protein HY898_27955 [Deltaproteobacteria bacterium]|nr:hypothetical protein [Deltaproteobacteria bacterium]